MLRLRGRSKREITPEGVCAADRPSPACPLPVPDRPEPPPEDSDGRGLRQQTLVLATVWLQPRHFTSLSLSCRSY